jgi:uncharacterized repeat protein (TIGR03803 family)
LIISSNTLYGTTTTSIAPDIGVIGGGTLFRADIEGAGFTNLVAFSLTGVIVPNGLVSSGTTLYGTTASPINWSNAVLFAVNRDGTGFTNLDSFGTGYIYTANWNGFVLSGNTLYATAPGGGGSGYGIVFAVKTDGTGFTTLHSFTDGDGANPTANLILSENTLYGTTAGTVFKVNTDGTGFTNLYSGVGSASLLLSANTLYGTEALGGSSSNGTVFSVKTDGTGFRTLHTFTTPSLDSDGRLTNSDGTTPVDALSLSGNTLYGTANGGGAYGNGTVFKLNTDGTGFTTLHMFSAFFSNHTNEFGDVVYTNSDGAYPHGLTLLNDTLYGTASAGGMNGYATPHSHSNHGFGTIFSLSFQPQLTTTRTGDNLILTWPTNYAGFDYTGYRLQSTTNLGSPVWTTNLPGPAVLNGQYVVTNTISDTNQLFRLNQ